MIVNDEAAIGRKALATQREEAQEKFLLGCAREVKDHIHVDRMVNAQERLGRPLFPAEFERRLLKLNPNLYFEVIDENPSHKRLSVLDARGKHFVAVYPNALLPERSILKFKEIDAPDPNFTGAGVSRSDLPTDPDAVKPGWRRILIPWGEHRRGWRTVLVRLIQAGLITTNQAEVEFGSDETPEWRHHTGKGEELSLI